MRAILLLMTVLLAGLPTSLLAQDHSGVPEHSIVLSAGDGPFLFGRAVSLTVSYRNHGKDPWVIPTPSESTSAWVRYRSPGSNELPHGYSLRRLGSTHEDAQGGGTVGREPPPNLNPGPRGWDSDSFPTPPIPEPIPIGPGARYEFPVTLDLDRAWYLVPGRWVVWFEDRALKLESNRAEIVVRFGPEFIAICLRLTEEDNPEIHEQITYGEWLQKIMPGLELNWWYSDTPAAEVRQLKAEHKAKMAGFRTYLNDKANAAAIAVAIARINREAGLPPDEPKP